MRRIVGLVLVCHLAGLSLFCYSDLYARLFPPKKEVPFKVKIGAATPSHGPAVGPPERRRPKPTPPAPAAKPPPEPPAPKPKPKPPKPKPTPPKPKPTPVKPKPKPVKPKAEPSVPKPTPVKPKAAPKPKAEVPAPKPKQLSRIEREQQQVYRPPESKNFNPNVPIGSRDAAQLRARKSDGKTPQGGLTPDEEAYNRKLGLFIKDRWHPPASIQLQHDLLSPTIEVEIDGAGSVRGSRLVQPSGNRVMDDSARRLLSVLDRLPAPPNGNARTLQIVLKAEE